MRWSYHWVIPRQWRACSTSSRHALHPGPLLSLCYNTDVEAPCFFLFLCCSILDRHLERKTSWCKACVLAGLKSTITSPKSLPACHAESHESRGCPRRAEMRELVRDLRSQLRSGAAPNALPAPPGGKDGGEDGPAPLSAKEREELAVRLLASEGKPLDAQARPWRPFL